MTKLFTVTDLSQNRSNGPLCGIIPSYADVLCQQGYSENSAHLQLRFLNDMNQWLHQQQLQATDLSEKTIHRYMASAHDVMMPR